MTKIRNLSFVAVIIMASIAKLKVIGVAQNFENYVEQTLTFHLETKYFDFFIFSADFSI